MCFSDPLHAYFGVCGLTLMGEPGLKSMHPSLNVSLCVADRLERLQQAWGVLSASGKLVKVNTKVKDIPADTPPQNGEGLKEKDDATRSIEHLDQKQINFNEDNDRTKHENKDNSVVGCVSGVENRDILAGGSVSGEIKDIYKCIGASDCDIGTSLLKDKHVEFFQKCLGVLPTECESVDASRSVRNHCSQTCLQGTL